VFAPSDQMHRESLLGFVSRVRVEDTAQLVRSER